VDRVKALEDELASLKNDLCVAENNKYIFCAGLA